MSVKQSSKLIAVITTGLKVVRPSLYSSGLRYEPVSLKASGRTMSIGNLSESGKFVAPV